MTDAPLGHFTEVIDQNRRWMPDWYSWLLKLVSSINSDVAARVVGPASSTDNAAARWDGATGKLLQDSPLIIADTNGAISRTGGGGIPIQGTNTNDSAAAGFVGELIESEILVAGAVSFGASPSTINITSISLPAGDWDVWGNIAFAPAGGATVTAIVGGINIVSATLPTIPGKGAYSQLSVSATIITQVISIGQCRLSLSGTTTVYLVAQLVYSAGTPTGYGYIGARRRR